MDNPFMSHSNYLPLQLSYFDILDYIFVTAYIKSIFYDRFNPIHNCEMINFFLFPSTSKNLCRIIDTLSDGVELQHNMGTTIFQIVTKNVIIAALQRCFCCSPCRIS